MKTRAYGDEESLSLRRRKRKREERERERERGKKKSMAHERVGERKRIKILKNSSILQH